MKKIISILSFLILITFQVFTQTEAVDVAELTIKVGGLKTEEVFYGFAEGDQIIFNFEELKGKSLKEIEIIELPSNSKFMDFKAKSIVDKKIKVNKKSIYKFSFRNSALTGRICKIKIQRIPKSADLISFNTDWEWKTLYDTTHTPYTEDSLIGYDTLNYKETIKELVKTERTDEMIMDKTQKVHSYLNENNSSTYLRVDLPQNKVEAYRTEKIIAWAYWIGVGKESSEAYAKNVKAMGDIASGIATLYGTPLAGIAVGGVAELLTPKTGEDVQYAFIDDFKNAQAFINDLAYYRFDHGKGIAAYGKNSARLQGTFYIGLYNDNNVTGIDANVKIVVIKEIKTYQDIEYDRLKITPKYKKLNKIRETINSNKIRVNLK